MSHNTTSPTQKAEGYSLSQFLTTLASCAAIAAVEIAIFIFLRKIFKRIYEPKTYLGDEKRRVQPLPNTFYGWLPALLRMPHDDLIRTSGLDAYLFARYLYIHLFFFLSFFVLLAVILLPIYVVDGKGESYGKKGLDILTFGNISSYHSSRYAAPLVLAYVLIIAYLYIIYAEMKSFVENRQALLRSSAYQSRTSATTILVTSIPQAYMHQDVLFRIFDQFPGGVKHIWLNRNFKDLADKADRRMEFVEKLETVECKLIKTTLKKETKRHKKVSWKEHQVVIEEDVFDKYIPVQKRPTMRIGSIPLLSSLFLGKKVDTINYCKETISQLNTEIERAKVNPDNYALLNSAFIRFNKQIAAHMALQSVVCSIPLDMTSRYIDIKPANIIWSNLQLSYYQQKFRELLVLGATTVLIIFWSIPVSFIGILSNLTYLTNKLTFLRFIYDLPNFLVGLITGLLPTVLLAVLMALLPMVLTFFAKISGIPTTDAIDRHVQATYFVFQVVHVFLFVSISSSITSVITLIIENPTDAAKILATNIPTSSNFFFSFLALQGLSVASGLLLQVVTLVLFYLLGKLFDNTPRQKWRRYFTLTTLNWGTIFPIFTNFVVISLVYSVIAPLMLLISGIAFSLFYIAYTYTMFYVSDFPNDTGGLAFSRAIYQSFTGVYLMEIMLAGLFLIAQNESGKQAAVPEGILMFILLVITIGVQWTISSSFDPLTNYLPVDSEEFAQLDIPQSRKFKWAKTAVDILRRPIMTDRNDAVRNINDAAAIVSDEDRMENAYLHPAMRDPKPIVWIPRDPLGIATNEVERTVASGLNILMSTDGARYNEKMNIEIDGPPPAQIETTEVDNV